MSRTTLLIVVAFVLKLNCFGATFCAVRILATDRSGDPAPASAELVDSAGHLVKSVAARDGELDFCDFGFGEHTINVSTGTCGAITIHQVRLIFGRPQVYRVYANMCRGDVFLVGCSTYLRVVGADGGGLSGVSVTSDPPGLHLKADEYGRVLLIVDYRDSRTSILSKPGYMGATIRIDCSTPAYKEQGVVLKSSEK